MDTALRWISHRTPWVVPASIAVAACTSPTSATDLHPEGPPMIEQVRLKEVYAIPDRGLTGLERVVFAFGTHPDATPDEEHPVTTARAAGNKLRIIMDELLRGNNLEEIACRAPVDDDVFARVPLGATPDDIARCAVPDDVLPVRCPGSDPLSLCICARDGGCLSEDGTSTIPKGNSVGVLDRDMDGAADATQFIAGAVGIRCGAIDVPIDLIQSYWTPSGNQQAPAQGGFDALGPAIVLVPKTSSTSNSGPDLAMPTGMDCNLVFSPDVVDKDGNQVCAPPDGDITGGCTPGDTSAFHFTTEPLAFIKPPGIGTVPQSRTAPILIQANVPLDPASLANITVTQDPDVAYTQFTATLAPNMPAQITISWTAAGGLAAATRYTITIPTTVTDRFQQGAPQPLQIAFTTAS